VVRGLRPFAWACPSLIPVSVSLVGIERAQRQPGMDGLSMYIQEVLLHDLAVNRVSMLHFETIVLTYPPPIINVHTVHCIYLLSLVHIISFRKINHCGAQLDSLILCLCH
jgi:hypothetical protein